MKSLLTFGIIGIVLFSGCEKKVDRSNAENSGSVVVPQSLVKAMAEVFNPTAFFNLNNGTNHDPIKNTLNGNNTVKSVITINDDKGEPAVYICNFADAQGFLIMSADYRVKPILGFAEQGNFNKDVWDRKDKSIPPGFRHWVNMLLANMNLVREGATGLSTYGQTFWSRYIAENKGGGAGNSNKEQDIQVEINVELSANTKAPPPPPNPCTLNPDYTKDSSVSAGPLVPYTWGQAQTYNEDCPNQSCTQAYGPNALVGCVPTALSMVMAYWKPITNTGYNWASMPATSGNSAVEQLMADLGHNTATSYGCAGTGTDPGNAAQGFNNVINESGWHLGTLVTYSTSNATVIDTIVLDLSHGDPVFLSANDPNAGPHFWVVDGFEQVWETYCGVNNEPQTDYAFSYHMNWGFHEYTCNAPYYRPDYNGWYDYSNWPTSGGGPNGSGLNFDQDEQVLYEVHPV